jgi:hypothetical protein
VPAGIESLTGLVLITWTASFSYLSMERFWGAHGTPGRPPGDLPD